MLMSKIFDRFVAKTPVSVMARAAMEHAMAPEALDALFVEHANKQYTRELLFSSVVDLMGVVVSKVAPSVHAASPFKVTFPAILPTTEPSTHAGYRHIESSSARASWVRADGA